MNREEILKKAGSWNMDSYFRDLLHCTTYALGNVDLSKELCEKLIELYKIQLIVEKPFLSSNPKGYNSLFVLKFLELIAFNKGQKQMVENMNPEELSAYRKTVDDYLTQLRNYVAGTSRPENASIYDQMKSDVAGMDDSAFKALMTSTRGFLYANHWNYPFECLKRIASTFTQEQITEASSLDVEAELANLRRWGAFANYANGYGDKEIDRTISSCRDQGLMDANFIMNELYNTESDIESIDEFRKAIIQYKDEKPKAM